MVKRCLRSVAQIEAARTGEGAKKLERLLRHVLRSTMADGVITKSVSYAFGKKKKFGRLFASWPSLQNA
jgi:hypothetical protein